MSKIKLRVASAHHAAVRFECSIDVIWDDIVVGLGSGRRFQAQGYRVAPVADDPRAYLGGYRMWRDGDDDPDERLTFISERDDAARRLSLHAHYLGPNARGTIVNATYSATRDEQGHWYRIDCHATQDIEVDEGVSPADVATIMAKSKEEMDHYLRAALEAQKPDLEGARSLEQTR
jgi:hypothetical protein